MTRLPRPRPILLAVLLAPISLLLGYLGYRSVPESMSRTDALYSALQLFAVGGVIPSHGTPWQLDVARFLAPVAVVYAGVVAAAALLRNQAERLLVAMVARDHVLVVGLGATGSLVARGLRRAGRRVVALEINPLSPRVAAARAEGVHVILGDGASKAYLLRGQVDRARHVIILTADDSRNLEVAAIAREIVERKGRATSTTLHVAIAHGDLWKELDRLRVSDRPYSVITEYVNLADRTAQRVLSEAAQLVQSDVLPWVLVDGDTTVASRVVAHVVRRALLAGVRPRIDLTCGPTGDPLARLRVEEPWSEQYGEIRLLANDGPEEGANAPLVLVCLEGDDAAAVTRALVLARRMPTAKVLVAVYRERGATTLEGTGTSGDRIRLVSAKVDALGLELLERSSIELMARVRHEHYVAQERAAGNTTAVNSSLVPWEELPESLKESNRRFAESVAKTVGRLGGTLVPLTGPVSDKELAVTPEVLDELARGEHDRWMAALVRDGWRPTDGVKDPMSRLHPLLVPWEQLPESERDKDRDAFRALPHMLARVGYSVIVPEGDEA